MGDQFIGEIRMVGFNFAPRGWLMCAGQLISISQNTALFSLLGTTYGGDGTSTFALPDLRGRSPVGVGSGPGLSNIDQGEVAGAENVTLLQSQMPAHTHTTALNANVAIPANSAVGTSKAPSNTSVLAQTADSAAGAEVMIYNAGPANANLLPFNAPVTGSLGTSGANAPLPIRNPYLGICFIIATEGVYPSRP